MMNGNMRHAHQQLIQHKDKGHTINSSTTHITSVHQLRWMIAKYFFLAFPALCFTRHSLHNLTCIRCNIVQHRMTKIAFYYYYLLHISFSITCNEHIRLLISHFAGGTMVFIIVINFNEKTCSVTLYYK